MLDRSRCIVIVPIYQHVEPRCDQSLRGLERAGYRVWRIGAGAAIDLGRNRLATWALDDGYREMMWIDSDIAFPVDAVDHLRDLDLPLVGGAYPKKGDRAFSFHYDGPELVMGEGGGLTEVRFLPAGFTYTKREIFETMIDRYAMRRCNRVFGESFYPFFQPTIIEFRGEPWYLPEDYAFCHRAAECGFRSMLDTRIRLEHVGSYGYSWEDATGERQRYDKFLVSLIQMPPWSGDGAAKKEPPPPPPPPASNEPETP